ncbi:hypothetical protein BKA62DRAFT_699359 [Auriculariales sp. MPI-PUGE-AT-0066]|nr:hypothetical protein BKA62DRAFT_699359 [Auriculariales sp. MPI-PUGE-AT-0066]
MLRWRRIVLFANSQAQLWQAELWQPPSSMQSGSHGRRCHHNNGICEMHHLELQALTSIALTLACALHKPSHNLLHNLASCSRYLSILGVQRGAVKNIAGGQHTDELGDVLREYHTWNLCAGRHEYIAIVLDMVQDHEGLKLGEGVGATTTMEHRI